MARQYTRRQPIRISADELAEVAKVAGLLTIRIEEARSPLIRSSKHGKRMTAILDAAFDLRYAVESFQKEIAEQDEMTVPA